MKKKRKTKNDEIVLDEPSDVFQDYNIVPKFYAELEEDSDKLDVDNSVSKRK